MNNVLPRLAKIVLIQLQLTVAASAADAKNQKKENSQFQKDNINNLKKRNKSYHENS